MRAANEPGRVASGIFALLVHLLFFGLLVFGISWQKKIVNPVVVDLWEELPEPVRKVSPPPEPPKPAPVIRKEPPSPKVEAPPKVDTPPKPSAADIELREKLRRQKEEEALRQEEQKKLQAEKRRADEEERRVAEERRRAEEEEKRAVQEKQRREDEARKADEQKRAEDQRRAEDLKRDEERKQRAAAIERDRQQQEATRKVREAEDARRRAEAQARAAQQKVINDYMARIQAKVRGRVVLPLNFEGNPEARFEVVLLPGGEVLSTALKKSSGIPAYDAAVERAIMAAQPLPVPGETELFQESFRELSLVFRPKD